MRTAAIILATAALAGCTFKSTTYKQADAPPPVVYQAPPTVVYQAPAPTAYEAPTTRSVSVNYSGAGGFQLAAQKAADWCDDHYGASDVQLVRNDQSAGRATFTCVQR